MKALWVTVLDRFWAVPLLCAVGAAGLGSALSSLDAVLNTSFTLPFLFAGGPEGARALLSAIMCAAAADQTGRPGPQCNRSAALWSSLVPDGLA